MKNNILILTFLSIACAIANLKFLFLKSGYCFSFIFTKNVPDVNFFVKMNEKQYPDFKNKNLRLAIAQAIDKKGYVDSVKNNGSIPSDTLTAKGYCLRDSQS
jgi:ABC-type oligopeptide transport system substrate-binding subunit